VYPSYGYEKGPHHYGAVLIYNWSGDAQRWSAMSEKDQIQRALADINIMYKHLVRDGKTFDAYDYYTGVNYIQPWN